ncbi:MAG: DUF4397 domain-containing protein [Pseudomonadota bacterium]|nr:DUF4397 domain-containing protein [Pseudomonadota bacterium]
MSIFTCRLITLSLVSLLLNGCFGSSKGNANIRILNTSIDYSSVDLWLDNGDSNSRQIAGATSGTLGSYKGVGANSYTVEFTSNNVQSSLKSVKEKLSKNTHRTYVAYGNTGKFGTLEILEDQDKPSSSYTKVQLVDAAPDAGSVDVYLTDPSVAINNASPTFSSVSGGSIASAGFTTISSGTYRIRVTAAGSQTDIRLDSVTGITFSSEEILSVIITGTSGGVLVNGAVLPQQGSLTVISNPYARVRAAAAIPSGQNLSATLGGTNLLGSAAANTVSNYVLVSAGAQTLNLVLTGTTLPTSTQTLTAGDDYTVLVSNGSAVTGTTTTLIADDNRYPSTSTYAKVKLVNAMSGGAGDPVSLNVNYTPVASAIALSQASPSVEVTAGTNTEIDTVDATTSTTLFTNTTATLNGSGVYSLFMFGSATAPIGALRINR